MRIPVIVLLLALLVTAKGADAQFVHEIPAPKALDNEPDTVSVTIIGDVMMHARQLEYDHKDFFRHISRHLQAADFSIANLEFTLGGEPYSGYPAFSTPDSFAGYLAEDCGIDVFLCANNHILDTGDKGLVRTLNHYEELKRSKGIKYTGAALNEEDYMKNYPLYLFKDGIKIALLNFTYGTNIGSASPYPKVQRMIKEDIAAAIERAENAGADFIVALPHWGDEYRLIHNAEQEELAEWMIFEGVDAIVGSHPHVVQDSTGINGKPVIYSVGNAVSNMSARNTRLELMVTLSFVNDHISKKKSLADVRLDYMWCSLPGMLSDNYSTIIIKEWATRRSEWLTPNDFDNMMITLKRVTTEHSQ